MIDSMTVGELINELREYDKSRLVVIAKDAEGNGYSPLRKVDPAMYKPDSTWSGEIDDEDEPGRPEDGYMPCLVLWPIN